MTTLEELKWNNRIVAIIYHDNQPIGWCATYQEADALCDKYPHYQWDFSKKIPQNLPMMTLSTPL